MSVLRRGTPVFLSWIPFHGRSAGLASALGAEAVFVASAGPGWPAPVRYALDGVRTVWLLLRRRPRAVVVMLPPYPLLLLAWVWSRVTGAVLVGDLHSGVFNNVVWAWARRPTLRLLRRGHAVVTNEVLATVCREAGVPVLVLHDSLDDEVPPVVDRAGAPPLVLVPVSYAADEPVGEVLDAARRHPGVRFVLTGRAPASLTRGAPANVEFPGYVSSGDYARLLGGASAVLALTTREDTMQRAGYEAATAGRPLVTSSTRALREFFGDAAVYAEPTVEGIAEAVAQALGRGEELGGRMRDLHSRRLAEQQAAIGALQGLLGSAPT